MPSDPCPPFARPGMDWCCQYAPDWGSQTSPTVARTYLHAAMNAGNGAACLSQTEVMMAACLAQEGCSAFVGTRLYLRCETRDPRPARPGQRGERDAGRDALRRARPKGAVGSTSREARAPARGPAARTLTQRARPGPRSHPWPNLAAPFPRPRARALARAAAGPSPCARPTRPGPTCRHRPSGSAARRARRARPPTSSQTWGPAPTAEETPARAASACMRQTKTRIPPASARRTRAFPTTTGVSPS